MAADTASLGPVPGVPATRSLTGAVDARSGAGEPLRIRWLGRVGYEEALALQHGLHRHGSGDHLLLLEHPHVYTLGVRARREHLLFDPDDPQGPALQGATVSRADRGGDVTYHGPGQLVGYPVFDVPTVPGSVPTWVGAIEQLVIEVLDELGLPGAGRLTGYPGVWIDPEGPDPRKICAIGVRVTRGRSMHGFALNVAPDLARFSHIVPCGISDKAVTSLAAEGVSASLADAVEAVARRAPEVLLPAGRPHRTRRVERQEASAPSSAPPPLPSLGSTVHGPESGAAGSSPAEPLRPLQRRLAAAGVDPQGGVRLEERKPSWLRVEARMGDEYLGLRRTMRTLGLVTVCEEAGCPNIYECWADGTATFMINGERCTRACGFCLVDTRKPLALDPGEPERVAQAVADMGLAHAVVTAVARDDLADGGAAAFAETIDAVRRRSPETRVEVLISDCKGDPAALRAVFAARPDVLNHNLETVLRLQRAVRPSASYARSLSVLARAKSSGLTTKSGIILGMGETEEEVVGALADLAAVGVDIVTIGQYLRPSADHLPVAKWWKPEEFDRIGAVARAMGFAHVEASPLTRSSYHARAAAEHAAGSLPAAAAAASPSAAVTLGPTVRRRSRSA
ncbi:MAG: lipoic acid synthetase [Acidimicrobiaceae bacterium]|nr:lipoic acid synthetase [Acidimicrobiaceae bacterium]